MTGGEGTAALWAWHAASELGVHRLDVEATLGHDHSLTDDQALDAAALRPATLDAAALRLATLFAQDWGGLIGLRLATRDPATISTTQAELVGPADPVGGTRDDLHEYDRVMVEDGRTAVLVSPDRILGNT